MLTRPPLEKIEMGNLRDLLETRLPDSARAWLWGALAEGEATFDTARFLAAFSAAGRRLGAEPLRLGALEAERLRELSPELQVEGWGMDDLGRATLLLGAIERLRPSAAEDLVNDCFYRGDSRERQAVLRVLPLLPEPQRFLPTAIEACRSSVQPVFEAIACENPFPARYFPQRSFNQMVLKAVFTGVAIQRIVGLERRSSDELGRMAADYASERRAAGRHVPPDLYVLMSRCGGAHEAL
jgi:hypothetical protein